VSAEPEQYTPSGGAEILTCCGEYFQFENMADTAGMGIETIAHALAMTNRFGGHTNVPYSVAQHSFIVSRHCAPEDALWGLLHDASEAYLNDIVRPAKQTLPDYKWLERRVMDKVCDLYRLPWDMPASVEEADLRMCATEARDLLPGDTWRQWGLPEPYEFRVYPLDWRTAKLVFLKRYKQLTRVTSLEEQPDLPVEYT